MWTKVALVWTKVALYVDKGRAPEKKTQAKR